MNIYDYQRAGATIPAVSGYAGAQRAVPQALMREPTAQFGESNVRNEIDVMGRLSNIQQAQHELDMEKETMGLMKRENKRENVLGAGALGLTGLQAWQARKIDAEEARRQKYVTDAMNIMMESIQNNPDLYKKALLTNLKSIYMKKIPTTFGQNLVSPIPNRFNPQLGQFTGGGF